jgi:hypothetical protein
MIFNGHTHETLAALDDVTMLQIQTMYADGVIGNHKMIEAIGTLAAGVFNYMRPANSSPYKLANIIGSAYDYLFPPLSEEEKKQQVNTSLLSFMTQAPGFNKTLFKAKNG